MELNTVRHAPAYSWKKVGRLMLKLWIDQGLRKTALRPLAATLEASGGIKEVFSEVIGEMLAPYLDKLSDNAEKTTHYSQRTADNTKDGLTLDDYKVNKQLERVKADSGYSFTPALV